MDYTLGKKESNMSRRKVEMYEELLPDGRCKYRLPYLDPLTNKKKTLSIIMESQSASNYKLAKRQLDERLDDLMINRGNTDTTLRMLYDYYFEEKKRVLKPSTLRRDVTTISKMLSWMDEDIILDNLTVAYIKKTLSEHCEKNVTFNGYLKRFKMMLKWAYMNDYMKDRSVVDKLQYLPDDKKTRIEDKYLEREELQKLLDAATNKLWNYVIRFLALSGLRIGELMTLKDSDIDDMYIHVNSTYELNVDLESTPKTSGSIRNVYLRKELKSLVREIRAYMREYQFEKGIRSDYFICWNDGGCIKYDAFRKYLRELSEKVLGRKITPHALRHTATSLLIADGVPLDVVSRQLGHEDSKITKEIYMHVTQELIKRDNQFLEQAKVL